MHTILPYLLRRTMKVAVVGCGGTGQRDHQRATTPSPGAPCVWPPIRPGCHRNGWGSDFGGKLCPSAVLGERDRVIQVRCPYQSVEPVLGPRLGGSSTPRQRGHDLRNDFDLVIGCVDSPRRESKDS